MKTEATPAPGPGSIAAVVVTYNRAELLLQAIGALLAQTVPLAHIVIVDNASSDDTTARLQAAGLLADARITYLRKEHNSGGAGGFCTGIEHCVARGDAWIWLTDDDAIARPDAIAALIAVAPQPANIYASVAIFEDEDGARKLCWPAACTDRASASTRELAALGACQPSTTLPFLGFLVASSLVRRIGLPDAGFFISGDDMEYVERARRHGAQSYLVRDSQLVHPRPGDYSFQIAGRSFFCLRLPPWRRYFYVRNKLVIARRYYGRALYTATLPGLCVRLLATLINEPARLRQLRAYATGFYDGWRGALGDPPARRSL